MWTKHVVQTATYSYDHPGEERFDSGYLDAGDNFYNGYSYDDSSYSAHHLQQQQPGTPRASLPTKAYDTEQHRSEDNNEGKTIRIPRQIWDKLSVDIQSEIKAWN